MAFIVTLWCYYDILKVSSFTKKRNWVKHLTDLTSRIMLSMGNNFKETKKSKNAISKIKSENSRLSSNTGPPPLAPAPPPSRII